MGVDPIWSNPVFVDASQNDTNKHIGKLALSLQQTITRSLHRFFLCPGACFVKIPVTFQARKAVFVCCVCIQEQSVNSFENNTVKLSVDEVKVTSL